MLCSLTYDDCQCTLQLAGALKAEMLLTATRRQLILYIMFLSLFAWLLTVLQASLRAKPNEQHFGLTQVPAADKQAGSALDSPSQQSRQAGNRTRHAAHTD